MSNSFVQKNSRKIEPEEYVDMALKNVLNFNASVAEKESLDLKHIMNMQIYLINQAETVLIGCGHINRKKKRFNEDELLPEEQKVFDALKDYYSTRKELFGANVERYAMRLLEQVVDGEYDSKVKFVENKLKEQVSKCEIDEQTKNLHLANYKYRLMLDAVAVGKKGGVFELEV